jgi:serine/threonine protein kinase
MEDFNLSPNLSPNKLAKLAVPPVHFSNTELIGQGGYGKVYRCVVGNMDMVSKIVKVSDHGGIRNINEIDIMSKLRHPNLMESRGVKTILDDSDRELASSVVIFMDIAFCDLHVYITRHNPLICEKTKLLYDTAQGLSFMHLNNILHLDIKAGNILIFKDITGVTAKLTDFGNSITVGPSGVHERSMALTTITYRAPELFMPIIMHAKSSDIWSYGILGLFIITGKATFDKIDNVRQDIYNKFSPNGRLYIEETVHEYLADSDMSRKYINLLCKVLVIKSSDRITAQMIVKDPLFNHISYEGNIPEHVNITINSNVVDGGIMHPMVDRPMKYDMVQYRAFDFMLRGLIQLGDSTQTIFLAGDLYQRILHSLDTILDDEFLSNPQNNKWSIFACVAMTCLLIAHKMIEPTTLSIDDLVMMCNHEFSSDSVKRTEEIIIETFGGILYRRNLYMTSKCHHKMSVAFDSLYNCFSYHRLDLDKWEEMSLPQCDDDCVSIAGKSFDFIYNQTYHHKISTGIIEIDTTDYVEYIYRHHLNDFMEDGSMR